MRRRGFLIAVASAVVHSAIGDSRAEKIARIGFLTPFRNGWAFEEGFHQGLRELGYVEGESIAIESRRATESYADLSALAVDLAHANVDVIATMSTPAARAALGATSTIPVVCLALGDPVGTGLVKSLAKPGGNATGVATLSSELASKRLDLLRQLAPNARRIACLANPVNPTTRRALEQLRSAAATLGMTTEAVYARTSSDIDAALRAMPWKRMDGLVVLGEPYFVNHGAPIAQALKKARMPAIFPFREHHEHGVLMSYGPDLKEVLHRGASLVGKIVKGAQPADLPVEQVSRVDLIIDLRVAREMGIKVPQDLLYRADRVIR